MLKKTLDINWEIGHLTEHQKSIGYIEKKYYKNEKYSFYVTRRRAVSAPEWILKIYSRDSDGDDQEELFAESGSSLYQCTKIAESWLEKNI